VSLFLKLNHRITCTEIHVCAFIKRIWWHLLSVKDHTRVTLRCALYRGEITISSLGYASRIQDLQHLRG
jgi:hypothetical protein